MIIFFWDLSINLEESVSGGTRITTRVRNVSWGFSVFDALENTGNVFINRSLSAESSDLEGFMRLLCLGLSHSDKTRMTA